MEDREAAQELMRRLREALQKSVPYNLSVHTFSNLRLDAQLTQTSREPGRHGEPARLAVRVRRAAAHRCLGMGDGVRTWLLRCHRGVHRPRRRHLRARLAAEATGCAPVRRARRGPDLRRRPVYSGEGAHRERVARWRQAVGAGREPGRRGPSAEARRRGARAQGRRRRPRGAAAPGNRGGSGCSTPVRRTPRRPGCRATSSSSRASPTPTRPDGRPVRVTPDLAAPNQMTTDRLTPPTGSTPDCEDGRAGPVVMGWVLTAVVWLNA